MRLCEDRTTRKDFGCQNSGTKIDLVRTCFKDGNWEVNVCQQIYYVVLSTKEESNGRQPKSGWTM